MSNHILSGFKKNDCFKGDCHIKQKSPGGLLLVATYERIQLHKDSKVRKEYENIFFQGLMLLILKYVIAIKIIKETLMKNIYPR